MRLKEKTITALAGIILGTTTNPNDLKTERNWLGETLVEKPYLPYDRVPFLDPLGVEIGEFYHKVA